MKGKKKIDVDPSTLPEIKRLLVVLKSVSNLKTQEELEKLGSILGKSDRTDTFAITQSIIKEWAIENELWVDMSTWDGKKKLPEGVPTEWSETLKHEL